MSQPQDRAAAPRVALVHDFLLDLRGAERVFSQLCEMWPEAPIYTAVYNEKGTEGRFADRTVHSSFLQRLRPSAATFRAYLPLYPVAIESFDLSEYDLVVSSSSAWAHAVLCDERSVHVCYCHNPFRYAWNDRDQTLARHRNPISRMFLRGIFRRWRQWDWIAAQRTNSYVANSESTRDRIRAYFGRDASVVYPPVDVGRFSPGTVGEHYAIVSELMPHKRIDVAIEAFNRLRRPLVIVGDGPDARRLQSLAGPTVSLTGRLSDEGVAEVLRGARALIITAIEEFGIAGVEAQASGRPVIANRGGGALETIVDGVTGCWYSGEADELARTVAEFDTLAIDPEACTANARRFDIAAFRAGMYAEVDRATRAGASPPQAARQPLPTTRLVRRAVREAQR